MRSRRLWNNHQRIFPPFWVVGWRITRDKQSWREEGEDGHKQERNKKKKKSRKSFRTSKGESLNLSSSLWVRNERRLVGWKDYRQRELNCGSSPNVLKTGGLSTTWLIARQEYLRSRLTGHSEWSHCGPEGHLICHLISALNRRILYQIPPDHQQRWHHCGRHLRDEKKKQWRPQSGKHLYKK